jgi:phi LC3 family holin
MINIKARLKNKVFLVAIIPLSVALVYQILSIFKIVPSISEETVINVLIGFVEALAMLGILTDPTTEGFADSERAMAYYTENDVRSLESGN